jgi:S-adenosylmethionine decarboxylase
MMNSNGKHLILDMYGCDPAILDDYEELQRLMEAALVMAKATILRIFGHKFEPHGVTLLALLSESHASIHTWPEIGYCAIDLYTCNADGVSSQRLVSFLKKKLKAEFIDEKELVRSTTPLTSV